MGWQVQIGSYKYMQIAQFLVDFQLALEVTVLQ